MACRIEELLSVITTCTCQKEGKMLHFEKLIEDASAAAMSSATGEGANEQQAMVIAQAVRHALEALAPASPSCDNFSSRASDETEYGLTPCNMYTTSTPDLTPRTLYNTPTQWYGFEGQAKHRAENWMPVAIPMQYFQPATKGDAMSSCFTSTKFDINNVSDTSNLQAVLSAVFMDLAALEEKRLAHEKQVGDRLDALEAKISNAAFAATNSLAEATGGSGLEGTLPFNIQEAQLASARHEFIHKAQSGAHALVVECSLMEAAGGGDEQNFQTPLSSARESSFDANLCSEDAGVDAATIDLAEEELARLTCLQPLPGAEVLVAKKDESEVKAEKDNHKDEDMSEKKVVQNEEESRVKVEKEKPKGEEMEDQIKKEDDAWEQKKDGDTWKDRQDEEMEGDESSLKAVDDKTKEAAADKIEETANDCIEMKADEAMAMGDVVEESFGNGWFESDATVSPAIADRDTAVMDTDRVTDIDSTLIECSQPSSQEGKSAATQGASTTDGRLRKLDAAQQGLYTLCKKKLEQALGSQIDAKKPEHKDLSDDQLEKLSRRREFYVSTLKETIAELEHLADELVRREEEEVVRQAEKGQNVGQTQRPQSTARAGKSPRHRSRRSRPRT